MGFGFTEVTCDFDINNINGMLATKPDQGKFTYENNEKNY